MALCWVLVVWLILEKKKKEEGGGGEVMRVVDMTIVRSTVIAVIHGVDSGTVTHLGGGSTPAMMLHLLLDWCLLLALGHRGVAA